MRSELNRRKKFTRRALVLGGAKLSVLSILMARLYYLQRVMGQEYATLSDNNRIRLQLVTPERGLIYDRYGNILASNQDNFRAMLDPEQFKRLDEILIKVGTLIGEDLSAQEAVLTKKARRAPHLPLLITQHMSWQDVSRLEVHAPELPGLFISVGKMRYYPYAEQTAHLLGYVSPVSEKDEEAKQLMRLPDLKIGRKGIEHTLEESLRGNAGVRHVEVNALGLTIREISREESRSGDDASLAIDVGLQRHVYEQLSQHRSASAAILDIHSGEVRTLATTPSFDPNRFSQGISQAYWSSLLENPLSPLLNKAISGQYPPGSTFKMLVALAALEQGIISPKARHYCPGHYILGNRRFHCWERSGHGHVDMEMAIERSCDVYFYEVAAELGIEAISEMAVRFGLGTKTGIELPAEQPGIAPTPAWKKRKLSQHWQKGDTINASIGQGYVLSTPLQLAVMTARLITNRQVAPTLLKQVTDIPNFESIGVKEEHLTVIKRGMERVTMNPRGTAYWKRITKPGFEMAGKTGTSQVKSLSHTYHLSEEEKRWQDKHHALFVGYAPIHAPRFAGAVVVEHGGSGSSAAAPLMRDMLLKAQELEAEAAPLSDQQSSQKEES